MDGRTLRIVKLLWLPVLLLLMVAAEPYLGISRSPYRWAYIGVQVLLFIVYSYILFKPKGRSAERRRGDRKK